MIFLALVGYTTLVAGTIWLFAELFVETIRRRIKKTVEKCKKEWKEDSGKLKKVYVTEDNFVEQKVEALLRKVGLFKEVA